MIKFGFNPIFSTSYPITGPTRKGGIYSIGVKKDNKVDLKKIISFGKRESTNSVIYKYKYYNKIFGEKE